MISELVSAIVAALLTYLLLRKDSKLSDHLKNENDWLKIELESKHKTIGHQESIMGGMEKELTELERVAQEHKDLLGLEVDRNKKIISQKKSSEIRTGHIAEQLAPLMMVEHDPKNIRWLGQPIDFIAFDDNEVTFIEVKSGRSQLSHNQKRIKQLILDKKVKWKEHRIKGKPKKGK